MNSYRNVNLARLATAQNPINGQTANTRANVGLRVPNLGYQPTGLGGTYLRWQLQLSQSPGYSAQSVFTRACRCRRPTRSAKTSPTLARGDSSNSNDPLDQDQQYGPTNCNRPHRFILNYQYELPFGKHAGSRGKAPRWMEHFRNHHNPARSSPHISRIASAGSIYGASSARAQLCDGATSLLHPDVRRYSAVGWAEQAAAPVTINASAFCAPTNRRDLWQWHRMGQFRYGYCKWARPVQLGYFAYQGYEDKRRSYVPVPDRVLQCF